MPTVRATLHSAPTIDLLIIAAFYSQFGFFFSWTHTIRFGLARAKDQHFETHGHINMEFLGVRERMSKWVCSASIVFDISLTFYSPIHLNFLSILSPYSFAPSTLLRARGIDVFFDHRAHNENNNIENSSNHHTAISTRGRKWVDRLLLLFVRIFFSFVFLSNFLSCLIVYLYLFRCHSSWSLFICLLCVSLSTFFSLSLSPSPVIFFTFLHFFTVRFALIFVIPSIFRSSSFEDSQIVATPKPMKIIYNIYRFFAAKTLRVSSTFRVQYCASLAFFLPSHAQSLFIGRYFIFFFTRCARRFYLFRSK